MSDTDDTADARQRLLNYLTGVCVWNSTFNDARHVLTNWLDEHESRHAKLLEAVRELRDAARRLAGECGPNLARANAMYADALDAILEEHGDGTHNTDGPR